jgi:Tol biopolymer transport system component
VNFSRDGKWVAYVSYPERTLWRSRADGTDRLQLTYPPSRAGVPHWSPDGTQIVYQDIEPGGPWRSFLVSAQGGTPQEMFAWSHDGKYLYFETSNTDHPGYYRIKLGRAQPELLINLGELRRYSDDQGAWCGITPDGSPLFVRDLSTDEIYALDLKSP